MSVLVVQVDVRLRKLTAEGLEDVISTFVHYDLPLDAAGNDWTQDEEAAVGWRLVGFLTPTVEELAIGLLAHCRFEQKELPFG